MITIQAATPKDIREIRHLLVETWIRTYRGIFSRKFISKTVSASRAGKHTLILRRLKEKYLSAFEMSFSA